MTTLPRPDPAAPDRIPATIVTGFLGAGKTTLIRNLLRNAGGRRIALIVNEFGDVGFDGAVLGACDTGQTGAPGCDVEAIVELANGCICCTVADDFLPAMEALIDRDDPPDNIIIETSGLALPQPLVKAFAWPSVRDRVTVDGVVTIVDSAAVAEGRVVADEQRLAAQRAADTALDHDDPITELFEDQIRCADLIVLSKADLVDTEGMARVEAAIAPDRRSAARVLSATMGELPPAVVLGVRAGAENDTETRLSHHERAGAVDHEHDDFDSFVLRTRFGDRDTAVRSVRAAMDRPDVLRIKGTVEIEGKQAPLAIQAVGPRVETWFVAASATDRNPAAAGGAALARAGLVVIGLSGLHRGAISKILAAS